MNIDKQKTLNTQDQDQSQLISQTFRHYMDWIDCDVEQLSSVKLLNILRLSKITGCELDNGFINDVKSELSKRNDDRDWHLPH